MMAAVMTTLEHLDSCSTCHRRTLHRRIITRDAEGVVLNDVRACVVCANRAEGADSLPSPVLAMKESRSLRRKLQKPGTAKAKRCARITTRDLSGDNAELG
jgi:hypothetical protein